MRTFRCFDTPEIGCLGVCEPGGCGCEEIATGFTNGADPRGNKQLRAYPRVPIRNSAIVPPFIGPAAPIFNSEEANGALSGVPSHTRKRLVIGENRQFRQASCYTPFVGDVTDTSEQTFDLFGCPGLDPYVFPNYYTSCGHVIEGERDMIRRVCTRAMQGREDVLVEVGGHRETHGMVFVHSEPCIVLDNTRAYGNLWTFGTGVGQDIYASPTARNAWTTMHVRFNGLSIKRDPLREKLADAATISLQSAVLNQFNNANFLDALNIDRLRNQRYYNPNTWDPSIIDRWEATYDVLAPGATGCAGAYRLRSFPARMEQAGCEFTVDWVVIYAKITMSMLLYMVFDRQQGQPGNPPTETRIYPTIQMRIDVETALRPRGLGPCTINAPWLQPGPIPVLPVPCVRVPRNGTNVENERIIVLVGGQDVEPPRFITWKGERGPETSPPWSNIYGGDVGGNNGWSCCMVKNLIGYQIPGKGIRAAGNQLTQLNGYNPTGVEHWQGTATINPNLTGDVDSWCASYLTGCTPPENP